MKIVKNLLSIWLLLLTSFMVHATDFTISSVDEFNELTLSPGDNVIWLDGTYSSDERLKFLGNGTASNPITLRAETPGGVIFNNGLQMDIAGNYLVVDGFYWNGGFGASNFIQFRNGTNYAQNCTIQNCAINGLTAEPGDAAEAAAEGAIIKHRWIVLYGNYNNVLNCSFMNKDTAGALILTENEYNASPDEVANTRCDEVGHTISNNYFYNYTKQDSSLSNAGDSETIRVGTSEYQNVNSATTVSGNYFVQSDGENEIISNKSMNNTYTNNTFRRCRGSLVMRHGANATVDGNYFLGENVQGTGGIRIADSNHQITNNYIQDCVSSTEQIPWNNGLTFVGGNTNSVQNCNSTSVSNAYQDVENINFSNNTFINTHSPFYFNATRDGADDVFGDVTNNLIYFTNNNDNNTDILNGSYAEIGTNLGFAGNVYNSSTAVGESASGFSQESISVTADGEIFTHNQSGKGASISSSPINDNMVGNGIGACFLGAEGNNGGSCEETTVTPSNSLTAGSISQFNADGGSEIFNISSNVSWTVSESTSWITINRTSGSNNGSVTVTASENTNTNNRSATITVSGSGINRSVSVSQDGASNTSNETSEETILTLLNSYNIGDVGEPSGLAYDATNNQLFTVNDSDDIFRLSVTGNVLDTYDFSGDLEGVTVFDTNTLLVAIEDTYELVEYNYITGNTTSHTMEYDNQDDPGSGIEGVTYNPTDDVIYFLNEKDPAALIVANSNFNVTDEYELSFSGDLSASSYVDETGFLWLASDEESTVYKCDTSGNVIQSFPLEDDGAQLDKIEGIAIDYDNQLLYLVTDGDARLYVYSLNGETNEADNLTISTLADFNADGGTNTLNITANISWSANENSSWLTIEDSNGSNNGSIDVVADENTTTTIRTATITITGNDITRTVTVSQEAAEDTSASSYIAIPFLIQAEDYDSQSGIQTESTQDDGGGENVGFINTGDFLTYNISVPSSRDYTIDFRVASRREGTSFDIFSGNTIIGSISSNATGGWQNWETVSETVSLNQGDQTLRLVATGNGWNINWLDFSQEDITVEPSANLALTGAATQSTTTFNGAAIRAIDGNTNGAFNRTSVTHTAALSDSWWQVQLNSQTNIGNIVIYNRTDSCCIQRLSDFTVTVFDSNNNEVFSQTITEAPTPSITINANGALGNRVRITNNLTNTPLSLAEVEVYAGEDNGNNSSSCDAGTNLSLNSTVVDFSNQENTTNNVNNIIDDNDDNRWSALGFSQFVTLDLGDEYTVNEINLLTFRDRDYQFTVEGSTSSATSGFSTLVDASNNTDDGPINRTFSPQTVRYVKLTVLGANSYDGPWVSIHKFEVICAGTSARALTSKEALVETTIYPNPFSNEVNITINNGNGAIINLIDITGKVIKRQVMDTNTTTIQNLDNLASGIYLLQIFDTNNQIIEIKKLIKN